MRFAVYTASTPEWTPAEAAHKLATQGWDGIEWRVTDQEDAAEPGFWAGNRATWPLTGLEGHLGAIAKLTADAGLGFPALGGYAASNNHADVDRMLAATAELGAERVRVTMPLTSRGNYRDLFSTTRADVEWASARAAHHGVKALIEVHFGSIVPSVSAAYRMVDGLDPNAIGILHDVGNLVIEGQEDYDNSFELLGPYLAHVHLKNTVWVADGPDLNGNTSWHYEWATLADGQADLSEYVAALIRADYQGWVTVEDFTTAVPLEQRTAGNLAFLRTALQRALASSDRRLAP